MEGKTKVCFIGERDDLRSKFKPVNPSHHSLVDIDCSFLTRQPKPEHDKSIAATAQLSNLKLEFAPISI